MENNKQVTVFGATGKIGEALLAFLSKAGVPVVAVTRDIRKAVSLPFVTWSQADMADLQSLYPVMEGSSAVFLLSGYSRDFVAEQYNVIRAAAALRIGHMVKLSSGAVDEDSPFYIPGSYIAGLHGDIERLLKASGVPWTMLQPNGFMQNWLGELAQTVKTERSIYEITGEGQRAYVDIRDIAEVAFTLLTRAEGHQGKSYLLTGGAAVNYKEVAAIISEAIESPVTYRALTEAEGRQRMEQKGVPAMAITALMAYAAAQREGKAAFVSDAVPRILNKPARTVAAFVNEYADRFR